LSKETDQSIRNFILKNYRIDAIVTRSEGYNFSENTTLSEILLLCKKEKPLPASLTTYIVLKNLDSVSKDHVKYILESEATNQEIENPNYHAMTFFQKELNPENLFIPIIVD
jgi:hypothetical protein